MPLSLIVPLFLASGAAGVFGAVTNRKTVLGVFKPLTTFMLFAIVGRPESRLAWLVAVGILFSLGGDLALLSQARRAFLIGLGLFLVAHLSYIVAFSGAAISGSGADGFWSPRVGGTALLMVIVTALLLRKLWPGAQGMRAPLVGYAAALAAMVVSAVAAVGAGVSAFAAVGAALFYVSDSSLALDKFHRPIKNSALLTLGVYWLGQLGIALAARGV